jgi:oligogalacturonide transport system permease protein
MLATRGIEPMSDLIQPLSESTEPPTALQIKLQRRSRWNAVLRYTLLTVVGFVMIYPLLWLVGASFKSNAEMFSSAWFWPKDATVQGYIDGWKTSTPYTFATFFFNSMQIVIPKVIGTAISCTLVAYGFARFEFPGKKILFAILIATLLLPDVVTRIPQYLLFRELGWLDTYLPLIAPAWLAGDAFFVFMMIQFLRAIPREMEEAARVDGANTAQMLIFIVVPILMPALVSVCLFQFMWTMNDFLGPLIYISTVEKYPVSLALKLSIDATEAFNWNSILAMTVLALTPSLVVFFIAQKSFIEGISTGGVKG